MTTYEVLSYETPDVHVAVLAVRIPGTNPTVLRYTVILNTHSQQLVTEMKDSTFDVEQAMFSFISDLFATGQAAARLPHFVTRDLSIAYAHLKTFRTTELTYPLGFRYTRV